MIEDDDNVAAEGCYGHGLVDFGVRLNVGSKGFIQMLEVFAF